MNDVPFYLLTGINRQTRVFAPLLDHLPFAQVLDWPIASPGDSLKTLASRVAEQIQETPCYLGGVSFGGFVALEVSRLINPRGCFLISSLRHPAELPPLWKLGRLIPPRHFDRLLVSIGTAIRWIPDSLRTRGLEQMIRLAAADAHWQRWAMSAVLQWHPAPKSPAYPVYQIHGARDTTFPVNRTSPDVVLQDAGHVLAFTHANELAEIIRHVIGNGRNSGE